MKKFHNLIAIFLMITVVVFCVQNRIMIYEGIEVSNKLTKKEILECPQSISKGGCETLANFKVLNNFFKE